MILQWSWSSFQSTFVDRILTCNALPADGHAGADGKLDKAL